MVRFAPNVEVIFGEAGECPRCGFDSLRTASWYSLEEAGVSKFIEQVSCGRCNQRT